MIVRLFAALFILLALVVAYFFAAWHWSFSTGERAGWVQKLSDKGWVCKTWEGELSMVSMPGAMAEKFQFTVHDDAVAREITRHIGKRVALHYEEKKGLPGSCFGDTRYFVTGVRLSEEGAAIGALPQAPAAPAPTALPAPAAASR